MPTPLEQLAGHLSDASNLVDDMMDETPIRGHVLDLLRRLSREIDAACKTHKELDELVHRQRTED